MPKAVEPQNYRPVFIRVNNKDMNIIAMAKPDRGGHNIDESMAYLKEENVDVIISLDWKSKYEKGAKQQGIMYLNQHILDFEPPTFQTCDEIHRIVSLCAEQGKKVAIHCGAGHGRTGSVLAALKLKEVLEKNPNTITQSTKSSMLRVGRYGGDQYINCTPFVKQAVEQIRNAKDSESSVEIEKQINMLCEYEAYLISQRNNRLTGSPLKNYISLPISEHHEAITIAKKTIDIFYNQISKDNTKNQLQLVVQNLQKGIDKLSGCQDNSSATKHLNNLLRTIQTVNINLITDVDQKSNLIKLQANLGDKIETESMSKNFFSYAIPIYQAFLKIKQIFLNFFNTISKYFSVENNNLIIKKEADIGNRIDIISSGIKTSNALSSENKWSKFHSSNISSSKKTQSSLLSNQEEYYAQIEELPQKYEDITNKIKSDNKPEGLSLLDKPVDANNAPPTPKFYHK